MKRTDSIVIRVEPKTKRELQKMADEDKRKLSDFIRLKLEEIINKK